MELKLLSFELFVLASVWSAVYSVNGGATLGRLNGVKKQPLFSL